MFIYEVRVVYETTSEGIRFNNVTLTSAMSGGTGLFFTTEKKAINFLESTIEFGRIGNLLLRGCNKITRVDEQWVPSTLEDSNIQFDRDIYKIELTDEVTAYYYIRRYVLC